MEIHSSPFDWEKSTGSLGPVMDPKLLPMKVMQWKQMAHNLIASQPPADMRCLDHYSVGGRNCVLVLLVSKHTPAFVASHAIILDSKVSAIRISAASMS
jgi:hypothetical protein